MHKRLQQISAGIMIILTAVIYLIRYLWSKIRSQDESVAKEVILITGAAQGIGKQLAIQYGREGGIIVCVDINQSENEETAQELINSGITAHAFPCDVTNIDELNALKERIYTEVGPVTIVVANAGKGQPGDLIENISKEDVRSIVDLNLVSVIWMLKVFLPGMKQRNKGHIVAVASITGLSPLPGISIYSTTKKAVGYLMRAAREEAELAGKNVKFTTIYPDFTETKMCQHLKKFMPAMLKPEEVARKIIKAQKMGIREASIPGHYLPVSQLLNLIPSMSGLQINYSMGKLEGIGDKRAWGNIYRHKN